MKKLKIDILATVLFGSLLMFWACNDDDNTSTDIQASHPKMTISVPASDPTFAEKDSTFEFPITLSEMQIIDVEVNVSAIDGTATEGSDFKINTPVVVIPAFHTSATASVTVLSDKVIEDEETFTIQIGDSHTANTTFTAAKVKFTIDDATLPSSVKFTMDWSSEVNLLTGGDPINLKDSVDFDFYVYDKDGNEITDAAAASASSPESFSLPADLADGEYTVTYNPWNLSFIAVFNGEQLGPFDIPLTLSVSREIPAGTIDYDPALGITTANTELFYGQNGHDYEEYELCIIKKSGDSFEILKPSKESLGSVRKATHQTKGHHGN